MSTAAVVLAAGGGRRYGMPKALVEYEGSLLVERAVRTARAACDVVLVVLGAQAVDVWRTADLSGATVLANKDWETGMASSLRTGLDGLRGFPGTVDAALITLVDMPGMTPEALRAVAAERQSDKIYLRADGSIPYARIMQVMGALNAAGFNNIVLVTDTGGPRMDAGVEG